MKSIKRLNTLGSRLIVFIFSNFLTRSIIGLISALRIKAIKIYIEAHAPQIESHVNFPLNRLGVSLVATYFTLATNYKYFVGKLNFYTPSLNQSRYSSVEVIPGQIYNDFSIHSDLNELAIPLVANKDNLQVTVKGNKSSQLLNLSTTSFHYIKIQKGDKLRITADQGEFFAGQPLELTMRQNLKRKHILVLFIDGFSNSIFSNETMENLIPHTYNFFRGNGINLQFTSTNEWTLPTMATASTGLRAWNHGIWHPSSNKILDPSQPLLSEFFQSKGFLCSMFNSNYRMTPTLGYARGFNRTIYKTKASSEWLISQFISHLDTFKKVSQFNWVSLWDLHDTPQAIDSVFPDLHTQLGLNRNFSLNSSENFDAKKSVDIKFKNSLKDYYQARLRELDRKLAIVYDRLRRLYDEDELDVYLISDHGQSYIENDDKYLAEQRTRVPFFVKSTALNFDISNFLYQTTDIPNLIVALSGLENTESRFNIFFKKDMLDKPLRKFAVSESIYPKKTYKCRLRDTSNWIEFHSPYPLEEWLSSKKFELVVESTSDPKASIGNLNQEELISIHKNYLRDATKSFEISY